jgi:hypothetical protein
MKITNKRILATLLIAVFIVSSLAYFALCAQSRLFSKTHLFENRKHAPWEGEPRIALIGDSWIAGNDLDPYIAQALSEQGWKVTLDSFGQPGARSKRIYQNLIDGDSQFSSRSVIFGDDPYDLVVIVAGVNDSAGYMGADYYVHHMRLIINTLIERGSIPVIVELPEFGIEKTGSNNPAGYVRRQIFRHIFNGSEIDVIADYRDELKRYLLKSGLTDEDYLFVDFDQVARHYSESLEIYREDLLHLNDEGNKQLSKAIAREINEWLTRRWRQRSISDVASS